MNKNNVKSSQDLTEGSVLTQLTKYAVPIVVSNILQALYSMTDIIISGQFIGSNGISAINNASQITGLITNTAIGLCTGGSIVIGQYFGARDDKNRKQVSGTLFSFSMLIGVFIAIALYVFAKPLLVLLKAPCLDDALIYLKVCAVGMFPVLGYNAISSILRSIGDSKRPFIYVAISTMLNVVLDLIFIGPMSMGTFGAALATVISQVVAFILSLLYIMKKPQIMEFNAETLKIRKNHLFMILKLGIPSILQSTIASISWLTVTFLINSYGVVISAGNGISIKIKDFCQLFISAMASATTAMVAQNLGAEKYDRAKNVMFTAMKITFSMAVVLIIVVEIFAPYLARIFNNEQEVINAAVLNMRIEIIGQLFYAQFLVYHALAIGAGHAIFAMSSSFVNCIVVRMVLAITLNHFFGLTGLYLACMIAPSASVPLGWLYTRSNVWRKSIIKK